MITPQFNEALFHKALKKRGYSIRSLGNIPVWVSSRGKNKELLFDIALPLTTFPAGWVASDKILTKVLLKRAGVCVSDGKYFTAGQTSDIISYAKKLKFPVVLKPAVGTHGDHVYPNIETPEELEENLQFLVRELGQNRYIILEKYIPGDEFRIFITKKGDWACVKRTPPTITGDGKQSIIQIIQIENYKRMHPRVTCLCEIKLDDVLFKTLEKQELTLDSIPAKRQVIQLRTGTNVSKGGNCEEVTPRVHRSVADLAKKVLKAVPGLSLVGIDLICSDITQDIRKQPYAVCEINSAPGLSLHMMPPIGKPVDVASYVVNVMN
jgi:cyanophycin synthetase